MASNSKPFFSKLKDTCRKIDKEMDQIKSKMIVRPDIHEREEVSSKKICEIQDKINCLKTDASNVKSMLGPKLAHTRDFIKNFKELMAETEVSISKKEEHLKQYGYVPMESVPQVPEIENNVIPDQKIENVPATPKLLDYGISSYNLATTPKLNRRSSIENLAVSPQLEFAEPIKTRSHSDSTPTLDIAKIISTSKPKETPPFPEKFYTPVKETPPLPDPVACNSVNFPSTPKLNI